MSESVTQISLQVDAGADADPEEIDDLTAELRERLLELDVETVEPRRGGEAPAGTRAGDVLTIGGPDRDACYLAGAAQRHGRHGSSWLSARSGKTVELEINGQKIKLTGVSSEEQRRLIDLFVEQATK